MYFLSIYCDINEHTTRYYVKYHNNIYLDFILPDETDDGYLYIIVNIYGDKQPMTRLIGDI